MPLDTTKPAYPGEMEPSFKQIATIKDDGYRLYRLTCDMHVGTHIDAPAHMLEHGKNINEFPLDRFTGNAKIIDAQGYTTIDAQLLDNINAKPDDILLIYTGYKSTTVKHGPSHPVLTKNFVEKVIAMRIKMIGLDIPSPDQFPFERHKQLFEHNILIIENLINLDLLISAKNIEIFAFPLLCNTDGALARVVARIS